MFDNLGFVKEDGEIVSHRTRLKIVINPVLRIFGWEVASIIDTEKEEFLEYTLRKYER